LQYRQKHEEFLYEVIRQQQEQNIYRIQQQYDYENLQNALNRKIILRHRIILIISLLLLAAAVIILVLQFRHKQMQEAEAEMQRQIDNLKSDLKQSVKTSYLEQELSSRLRLIISAYRKRKKGYDPNNEWSSIVYKLMNGKESLFDAVLVEMEKVYPDIYAVLCHKYLELNETETKVCLLSCSDLSNTEMAEILEMSKYTIDKNRSKLRDKLNLKPEKMKEQLHQVLSN
jgi:DNA-binding CsgD family transcriptional regulator